MKLSQLETVADLPSDMFIDIKTCFRSHTPILSPLVCHKTGYGNGVQSLFVGNINDFYAETASGTVSVSDANPKTVWS